MRRKVELCASIIVLSIAAAQGWPEGRASDATGTARHGHATLVEIAFLSHPPVLGALVGVDKLLVSYGDRVSVVRYDLETDRGVAFARAKHLAGHFPLAIFVNGSMEITLKDRRVKFFSFPKGQGTWMVASGTWSVDDLREALDQALDRAR